MSQQRNISKHALAIFVRTCVSHFTFVILAIQCDLIKRERKKTTKTEKSIPLFWLCRTHWHIHTIFVLSIGSGPFLFAVASSHICDFIKHWFRFGLEREALRYVRFSARFPSSFVVHISTKALFYDLNLVAFTDLIQLCVHFGAIYACNQRTKYREIRSIKISSIIWLFFPIFLSFFSLFL